MRVLVVDDEPGIRDLVALTLQAEGIEVATAEDGEAALAVIENERFDAIVLDLEMPILDGRLFFHALRARHRTTPVLILSAYGSKEARSELGAEDALTKPFDLDELVSHVQALRTPSA